jgi:hypothetical protein
MLVSTLQAVALLSLGLLAEAKKEDRSFGHHGKPAEYAHALEGGIVKPWAKEAKSPWDEIMEIKEGIVHAWREKKRATAKKEAIKNKVEMRPLAWIDDNDMMEFSMMDIIALGETELKPEEKKHSSDEEDDLAMLSIMESTPDLCPLCHKEGHSLGHEEHKKFLAKLRKEGNAPLKVSKDEASAKIMKSCKLCQAEGHVLNHKDHLKAEAMEACPLCKAEGHSEHHALHESFLAAATEFDWKFGADSKKADDLELISRAEKSFREDLLGGRADVKADSLWDDLKKFFGGDDEDGKEDDLDILIVEMATIPEMEVFMDEAGVWGRNPFMAASRLSEPERNFHLDDDEDEGEGEDGDKEDERSLWERLLDNLKEWFGGESSSSDSSLYEVGRNIAIFLFMFVGLFLTTLGIYEVASALMGGDSSDYERLRDEEQLMLEMESGRKGAIAI